MKIVHKYSEIDTIKTKFLPYPKVKPPRRNPSYTNKSNQPEYMREYMREYRKEKDPYYQKIPKNLKQLRKKYRQQLRKRFFNDL